MVVNGAVLYYMEMVAHVISANDLKRPPNSLPVHAVHAHSSAYTGKEFPGRKIKICHVHVVCN